jgi:hypothetical protein
MPWKHILEDEPDDKPVGFVIDFKPTGEVEAMHNDKFDLGFLGEKLVYRETDIKFDTKTQKWAIWPRLEEDQDHYYGIACARGFATYEGARQAEVAWINSSRLEGVHHTSPRGLDILIKLREQMGL